MAGVLRIGAGGPPERLHEGNEGSPSNTRNEEFDGNISECRTVVVFGQGRLEIGGGNMVWASLVSTPLHEEAIAQAFEIVT
jgi:hypothetical protein